MSFIFYDDNYMYIIPAYEIRGTIADTTTFRIRNGRQQKYPYPIIPYTRSEKQSPIRDACAFAVAAWKNLPEAIKKYWSISATEAGKYSGYHYFISYYLNDYFNAFL